MKLYPDQLKAAEEFENWLNVTSESTCGLWASAGFGKSFSAKYMINEVVLKHSNYIPVVCSMTHSAVEVLEDFIDSPVTTLHSAMGWIPKIHPETNEQYLSTPQMRKKKAAPRLASNHLVIIDEAGLMGHEELKLLRAELKATGARAMFIGDHKQCFPVLEDDEKLCIPAYEQTAGNRFKLTVPKRTTDGDQIYKLALELRKCIGNEDMPIPKFADFGLNPDKKTGVRNVEDIEEIAVPAFKAGVRDGNIRDIKILTFTNKRALTLNRKIRKKVLGHQDPIPTVGEEMIANTVINASTSAGDILIKNNEKLIVESVERTTSNGLEGAFIQYKRLNEEPVSEIVFVPATPAKLQDRLKTLSKKAKALKRAGDADGSSKAWRAFFSLKDSCADIRFTYAMTVNKAQGTTLKHAMVDMVDIGGCINREQMLRLAYTAVSRPNTYLTIEGELV